MHPKLLALALLPALTWGVTRGLAEAPAQRLPVPAVDTNRSAPPGVRIAVFSGGCFWGVQGVFSHVRGVTRAVSGYTGGQALTAHYETVSTGLTGHAESVQVTYDPKIASYDQLLRVFFSVALDPTEVDRQGPDGGHQYRSVLWEADSDQRRDADAYIRQLNGGHVFKAPIATQVSPLHRFYPAEGYHQDFMARHPSYAYVQAYDVEKVAALETLFPALYAAKPVTTI